MDLSRFQTFLYRLSEKIQSLHDDGSIWLRQAPYRFLWHHKIIYSRHTESGKRLTVTSTPKGIELHIDGTLQSGPYYKEYWQRVVDDIALKQKIPSASSCLVLGVGGGDIFSILHTMYPNARLTGVDIDGEVLSVMRMFFVGSRHTPYTTLVNADARSFVREACGNLHYDLVVIDVFDGSTVPSFVWSSRFLRDTKDIVRRDGGVVVNYFDDDDVVQKRMVKKITTSLQTAGFTVSDAGYVDTNSVILART